MMNFRRFEVAKDKNIPENVTQLFKQFEQKTYFYFKNLIIF